MRFLLHVWASISAILAIIVFLKSGFHLFVLINIGYLFQYLVMQADMRNETVTYMNIGALSVTSLLVFFSWFFLAISFLTD